MFKENIKMSWANIVQNKTRSFLTILGVLIGVASIIALISIVQGVTNDITSEVMDMGAKKITVMVTGTPLKSGLTKKDMTMFTEIDNINGVSPTVNGKANVTKNKNFKENISIQGRNQVHFDNTKDLLQKGRGINRLDVENENKVAIIGQDLKKELFTTENPIDKEIKINGNTFLVVGVLQESDSFASANNNESIIVPYTSAMSLLGTGYISSLDIYIDDENRSTETTAEINNALNTAFNENEDGFKVTNMKSILDTVASMTATMTLLLVGIASISLIVGGIGIMNMMLVTVTERTVEIGLRKALGAKPEVIQTQFLMEALFLSLFGGIIGIIIGVILSMLGSAAIGVGFTMPGYSIPLALGFSALVGLVFGYTPARKASHLNPIDALRSV